MSLWKGVASWFGRKKGPYVGLLEELDRLKKDLIELWVEVNTKHGRHKIRKTLEKAKSHIEMFSVRLSKVNGNKEFKTLVLTRNPKDGNKFFPKAAALVTFFSKIYKTLEKEKLTNKDLVDIKETLLIVGMQVKELKSLAEKIEKSLSPRPFVKRRAIDPHGAIGTTTDGISISKVIKLVEGLGFKTRTGSRHSYQLELLDGMPCALGSHSTDFNSQVRNRLARAAGRTPEEIDGLLSSL